MKKTQIGWVVITVILIIDAFVLYENLNTQTLFITLSLSLCLLLLFGSLTLSIDEYYLRFSFGVGLISKKYPLSKIESFRPISYVPTGFGIRFRPGVILFNVSGYKALELSIKGKYRKIWIGTNEPEAFAEYMQKQFE